MEIVELQKLCHSQDALTAAYRLGFPLQEAGWMLFPAACWDKPALVAMTEGACVAGINYSEYEDTQEVSVDFAFADAAHPRALVALLLRFRAKYRGSSFRHISFTCHAGNEQMAKAVRVLAPTPHTMSYRLPIKKLGIGAASREQVQGEA